MKLVIFKLDTNQKSHSVRGLCVGMVKMEAFDCPHFMHQTVRVCQCMYVLMGVYTLMHQCLSQSIE